MCIKETGIDQDVLEDFVDDDDVDRFENSKILKAYVVCIYLKGNIIDPELRTWRYDNAAKWMEVVAPYQQKDFLTCASGCKYRKTKTSTGGDLAWWTLLCVKRCNPKVCIVYRCYGSGTDI